MQKKHLNICINKLNRDRWHLYLISSIGICKFKIKIPVCASYYIHHIKLLHVISQFIQINNKTTKLIIVPAPFPTIFPDPKENLRYDIIRWEDDDTKIEGE